MSSQSKSQSSLVIETKSVDQGSPTNQITPGVDGSFLTKTTPPPAPTTVLDNLSRRARQESTATDTDSVSMCSERLSILGTYLIHKPNSIIQK